MSDQEQRFFIPTIRETFHKEDWFNSLFKNKRKVYALSFGCFVVVKHSFTHSSGLMQALLSSIFYKSNKTSKRCKLSTFFLSFVVFLSLPGFLFILLICRPSFSISTWLALINSNIRIPVQAQHKIQYEHYR